jgi:type IV secretory pathway TrbD component
VLERHALHPALYRPVLIGGVAAPFLFLEGCAVFLLLFEAGLHVATLLAAAFYCVLFHPLARRLSARDPQILELAVRSFGSADFYAAQPHIRARMPRLDPPLPRC